MNPPIEKQHHEFFPKKITNYKILHILRFAKNHVLNPKVSEFKNQNVELEGWAESQLSSNSGYLCSTSRLLANYERVDFDDE